MYCSKCGESIPQGLNFCTSCGCDVGAAQQAAAQPQQSYQVQQPPQQPYQPPPEQQPYQQQPPQQPYQQPPQYQQPPMQPQYQGQAQPQYRTLNSGIAAAKTAMGYFKNFFRSPATALSTAEIKPPEAAIYVALLPISLLLLLLAFIWRMTGDIARDWPGVSSSDIREELFEVISMGSAVFETILHSVVWFAIIIIVPIILLKLIGKKDTNTISGVFPTFAAAVLPLIIMYLVSAVITFIHMTAGMVFMISASTALGTVAFWIMHAIAVKRVFSATTEQAVYASIITSIFATIYSLFGVYRVVFLALENLVGDALGGFF